MIDYKTKIKVIGFDLDQTLYPKSKDVDEAIQQYIYQKIAYHKNISITEAKKLFTDLYQGGRGLSGSKTLMALGITGGKEIVQEALERANIASFLVTNLETISLLEKLKEKYKNLDILTGSNDSNTFKKLESLGIDKKIFNHIITADNAAKSDGSAYKIWLSYYSFPPENFLYIGDRIMSDYEAPKKLGIKSILVNIEGKDVSVDCLQLKSILDIGPLLL
ncbi:MAG: HAD family hydrolase [Patescibacteria group bacterium]